MSLSGKMTLITGGGKNLGALIATLFAAEGSNLALHYNSSSTRKAAEALAADLSSKHKDVRVKVYQRDLTTAANVETLFNSVASDFGPKLDIVINTVGMVLKKPLVEISEKEYDTMFAINSKAAFFITQEAARRISDGGKIINTVTSLLAAYAPSYTSYQGSKSPVEWFTKGLSKELMPRGISVNAVAPGPMVTFFYGQETPEAVEFHKSNAIGGRLTDIKDIAPIYTFLCTEGAWINGQTIFANGGYTSR
ncbi:alcohol dehydrogenase [Cladophialophora psammophila CBS 110553]|uniref:Alcohol dehydrogenase n=1 Tax=Cladophialophora psammophila CBS 110553 TaxID=1182543 RepID=W9WWE0_9EURO|nr:alcohol dehydrogenase [Cladophialophora psammophila CBS 110553]EXJ69340.1 alcohol dehydrogenase [Cladophialophora psammophila CBS 110553]